MTTPDPAPEAGRPDGPVRRPQVARTDPVRNILNAFRQEDGREAKARRKSPGGSRFADEEVWAGSQGDAPAADGQAGHDDGTARHWAPGPLWNSVADSVKAGYDVINQQIREGETIASEIGAGAASLRSRSVPDLLNRLMRTYSDIGAVWMDLLIATTEREAGHDSGPSARPRPGKEAGVDMTLSVEMTAARPATARARLYRPVTGALTVLPLRRAGPDAAEIATVSGGEGGVVRIEVPAEALPGEYHGIILEDGAEDPAGSVSVRIRD